MKYVDIFVRNKTFDYMDFHLDNNTWPIMWVEVKKNLNQFIFDCYFLVQVPGWSSVYFHLDLFHDPTWNKHSTCPLYFHFRLSGNFVFCPQSFRESSCSKQSKNKAEYSNKKLHFILGAPVCADYSILHVIFCA